MTQQQKRNTITAVDLIKKHEGSNIRKDRHMTYICTAGANTIGYGRNLDTNGLSEAEAELLLYNDINECERDLFNLFGKQVTPNSLLLVLIDMRYALGYSGFKQWKRLIKGVKNNSISTVIKEIKNSQWHRGIGKYRTNELIKILENNNNQ